MTPLRRSQNGAHRPQARLKPAASGSSHASWRQGQSPLPGLHPAALQRSHRALMPPPAICALAIRQPVAYLFRGQCRGSAALPRAVGFEGGGDLIVALRPAHLYFWCQLDANVAFIRPAPAPIAQLKINSYRSGILSDWCWMMGTGASAAGRSYAFWWVCQD
jgi:hypothetical protein